MSLGHNSGGVTIHLSDELADFVILNSETNMAQMLGVVQSLSSDNQVKMVGYIEKFRMLRDLVNTARGA